MKYILFATRIVCSTLLHSQDNRFMPEERGSLVEKGGYYIDFDEESRRANWVSYELTFQELSKNIIDDDDYCSKDSVIQNEYAHDDYTPMCSGVYERGHLKPKQHSRSSLLHFEDCNLMPNIAPQHCKLNQGIWKSIEYKSTSYVTEHSRVYVLTGPSKELFKRLSNKCGINIPKYFWKVILLDENGMFSVAAFICQNDKSVVSDNFKDYIVSINTLEDSLGVNFFKSLEGFVEDDFESSENFDWFCE